MTVADLETLDMDKPIFDPKAFRLTSRRRN